jgi:hypothetical protein
MAHERLARLADSVGQHQYVVLDWALDALEPIIRATFADALAKRLGKSSVAAHRPSIENGMPPVQGHGGEARVGQPELSPVPPKRKRREDEQCPVCDKWCDNRGVGRHVLSCAMRNNLTGGDVAELVSGRPELAQRIARVPMARTVVGATNANVRTHAEFLRATASR